MAGTLRVLLIEDSEDDAELLLRELRRHGYEVDWRRVDTAPELRAALAERAWDVITCDHVLRQFSALAALACVRASGRDVPILIVSDQTGDDVAVTAMQAGALDVIGKQRLARLVPAIERQRREADERRARHAAEARLRESDERYRALVETVRDVIFELDASGAFTFLSPAIERFSTFRAAELLGRPFSDFLHPDDLAAVRASLARTIDGADEPAQFRIHDGDGRLRWVRTLSRPVRADDGALVAVRGVMTDITAQVDAEEAYRTIFEHSSQGLALIQDDAIRLANAALVEVTGRSHAELLGTPLLELTIAAVHPDDRQRMLAAATAYIEGRPREAHFEFRLVHPDGALRHVLTTHADCTYRGAPARLVTYLNMTERVQAEAAYRTIFENSTQGLLVVQDDRVVMINPAVSTLTGHDVDTLARLPLREIIARLVVADDAAGTQMVVDRWLTLGQVVPRYALRVHRADGTEGVLYVQTASITHHGRPALIMALADLTDLWRAEEAYRAVFEHSLQALLVVSGPQILMANQAAAALSGWSVEEMLATSAPEWLERLVLPEDQARVWAALQRFLQGDATGPRVELRLRRRDGAIRHVVTSGAPIVFAGNPALLVAHMDVTDHAAAQAALRALNTDLEARLAERTAELAGAARGLEAVSYAVSHDLRAPLRSIDGCAESLLATCADVLPPAAVADLARLRITTTHMRALIDRLLELARVMHGDLRPVVVDLGALAREVAAELAPAQPGPAPTLRVARGLRAAGDPALLRALLANLLANAWTFTAARPRPRIEVGAQRDDAGTVFFVRDNGVGFDSRQAGRLFQPFQRLHPEGQFPGHGIGLATVQRIVERHGGRVWAESIEGEGATFYFTLP